MDNNTIHRVLGNQFLKILLPFELIYDIDVGLLKLIQRDFNDSTYFDIHKIDSMDDTDIINYSMNRHHENPLYGISNAYDGSFEDLDELYEDFMKTKYKEILELSNKTYLGGLYELISSTQGIKISIYYKSELELEKLKELNIKCDFIDCIESEMNLRRLKEFDVIYIKHHGDISNKIEGKNLYFANYGYNYLYFEDKEPVVRPEILLLSGNNVIKFADIYTTVNLNENINEEEDDEDE